MTATTKHRVPKGEMTVDEYLAWAESHPGKYELHDGLVVTMAAERAGHARLKFAVQSELARAIKNAGLDCHMLPDGMTVRTEKKTAFEPDALVYCGPKVPDKDVEIRRPVIVAEVLSGSTSKFDSTVKLDGYFRVQSIRHYLIFNPNKPRLVLHSRQLDETILTQILSAGMLRLDPPGIDLNLDTLFAFN